MRYLKGAKDMKLCFGLNDLELVGYCDADFAGNIDDKKSTCGNVFLFGGTTVSWLSKKQACIAKSTMEAKYISCSTTVSTAVYAKRFINNLQLNLSKELINLFRNSKFAIFFS